MITLSKRQVIRLHKLLIENTGGLDGLRDNNMLESALLSAFQTFDGIDLYPTVLEKITRISYNLIINHPFIDGNKRIGTYVLLVLLELNNIEIKLTDEEIVKIGVNIADGKMNDKKLLKYINKFFK